MYKRREGWVFILFNQQKIVRKPAESQKKRQIPQVYAHFLLSLHTDQIKQRLGISGVFTDRKVIFTEVAKSKKAIHTIMVTTDGLVHNIYAGDIQNEVCLNDLFY